MKKIVSFVITLLIALNCFSALSVLGANEPTQAELEQIIKTVKPRLNVPESYTEFSWTYNSANAYDIASWRLVWKESDSESSNGRITVRCDEKGNIISYVHSTNRYNYGRFPAYTKEELRGNAQKFLEKLLPGVSDLQYSYAESYGIHSGNYNYVFDRYIDGYLFSDNRVTVSVDFVTGDILSLNADYDYDLEISEHSSIISPEKASEILGTVQKMELRYFTKNEFNEQTGENTVKAFLVYVPHLSYVAVDAVSGEIYDKKSSWKVTAGGAVNDSSNGIFMDKAETEELRKEYQLTEQEIAGIKELSGLIDKEEAIRVITENEYLYIDPSLTAVDAQLIKNTAVEKTSTYQNDNGTYIWNLVFSNPVFDDKYYSYAYANASVNAQTGKIISYSCNLNDYYSYIEKNLEIPEVVYNEEQARKIGEKFLASQIPEKFEKSVPGTQYKITLLRPANELEGISEDVYGAYSFSYNRVNEGIVFDRNTLRVGVDGVTGKICSFNYTWYTNVEFESPKGAMSPDDALLALISKDGYGINFERNILHIYKPVSDSSKKDTAAAFIASLLTTFENGGDVSTVIDKYAEDIDRDTLFELLEKRNEKELLEFVCAYYGVSSDETTTAAENYIDSSEFYDRKVEARLVYSDYAIESQYISPFTGKQLTSSGDEYKPAGFYSYSDISGHWIYRTATLLCDLGVGFEGGKFEPDRIITEAELLKISESVGLYLGLSNTAKELDKITAVRSILNHIGYEKVANLTGIYKTDFLDNAEILDADIGYAAIAYGLGILKGDGQNARLYEKLTRAQALSLLVNAIAVMYN